MRQSNSVEMFKGKLKGYRYFQRQISVYQEQIELCYDSLGASPKSPNLSSEHIHSSRNIDREYETRDKISTLELKKQRSENEIKLIDEILGKLEKPLYDATIAIYCDGKTIESQAKKLYMARTTLQDTINKALDKAIKDTI